MQLRKLKHPILAAVVLVLSCAEHQNPFNPVSPNYDPPEVLIDNTSLQGNDSTSGTTITLYVSGNRPEVDIRYALDSAWSDWMDDFAGDSIVITGIVDGQHTVVLEGRYDDASAMDDTTFAFVKVPAPRIVPDTTSLLADTLLEIRSGSACTLTVTAAGTPPFSLYWYRDTELVDTLSGDTLILDSLMPADSGLYYCEIKGRWGQARSDSVFIRWLPPINNAPVALQDTFTIAEDGSLAITGEQSILNNDIDADGDTLTVVMVDSTRNGALTLAASGIFTYKPTNDFAGSDSFTYRVQDHKGAQSEPAVVRITVTAVNDVPVVRKSESITVLEGKTVAVTSQKLSVSDVDNTPAELVYTLTRSPENGSLMLGDSAIDDSAAFTQKNIDDGLLRYTHDGSETTRDTSAFSLADGNGGTIAEIVLPITVTAVNDTPYIAAKLDVSVVEGGAKIISPATITVRDNDNSTDELAFTMLKAPLYGTLKLSGTALDAGGTFTQEDIDSSRLTYQHNKGSNETKDSLSFSVRDKSGATITETVLRIRIGAVDDPPVALDQSVSLNEDGSLAITLSATDPEGSAIAGWEIPVSPKHGTLTGSGAVRTYAPEPDFFGADTFTFRASDVVNWSDTGIIAITVLPVNDAPQWKQGTVELSVKEGKTISLDLRSVFDKDPDGDNVAYTRKSGSGSIAGGSNVWSWTPGFNAAAASPASCIITATDNGSPAKSADITLSITVADSLCRLTTSVANGSGTIRVEGGRTMFDPGTVVRVTANPGTDYVFKNWGGDAAGTDSITTVTVNEDKFVEAVFVKGIETVTLNVGESYVHGSVYVNGYYYLTTRTSPAKVLKIDSDSLADYDECTFPDGYSEAEQIVYSDVTGRLYTVFSDWSRVAIAEIDPVTLAFDEERIVDTTYRTAGGLGHTMATDGTYLYVTAYTNGGITHVCKYSLSSFSNSPVAALQMDSTCRNGHALEVRDGILYMTGAAQPPWVSKVRTSNMTVVQTKHLRGGRYATDDFGMTEKYLFLSTESTGGDFAGIVYRVDRHDLDNVFEINTGVAGGSCYAVAYELGYIWAVFATLPGTITRIDPAVSEAVNYRLDYDKPNEIVSDGKRILITYWGQNPGRIQAFDPKYFEGRQVPVF